MCWVQSLISSSIYTNKPLIFFLGWRDLKACSGMKGLHSHIKECLFLWFFGVCTFEGWRKVFSDRLVDCFKTRLPLDSLLWDYRWGRRWDSFTVLASWFLHTATFNCTNNCGPLGACLPVRTMDKQREGNKRSMYGKSKPEVEFLRTCLYSLFIFTAQLTTVESVFQLKENHNLLSQWGFFPLLVRSLYKVLKSQHLWRKYGNHAWFFLVSQVLCFWCFCFVWKESGWCIQVMKR